MSLLTINFTETDETPSAVNLLTLTNAATGADVSGVAGVTLPKAFTLSGGAWTCTFTDTGLPLYGYTYAFTWSDGSTSEPITGTKRGAVTHYGSRSGMILLLGPYNENQAADIDGDGNATTIANDEEAALGGGDNTVNARLMVEGIGLPISAGDVDYFMLVEAANRYSAVRLSRMRGLPRDERGRIYDPYKNLSDEADEFMDRFIAGRLYAQNNVTMGPTSSNVSPSNRSCCGLGWC